MIGGMADNIPAFDPPIKTWDTASVDLTRTLGLLARSGFHTQSTYNHIFKSGTFRCHYPQAQLFATSVMCFAIQMQVALVI